MKSVILGDVRIHTSALYWLRTCSKMQLQYIISLFCSVATVHIIYHVWEYRTLWPLFQDCLPTFHSSSLSYSLVIFQQNWMLIFYIFTLSLTRCQMSWGIKFTWNFVSDSLERATVILLIIHASSCWRFRRNYDLAIRRHGKLAKWHCLFTLFPPYIIPWLVNYSTFQRFDGDVTNEGRWVNVTCQHPKGGSARGW